MTVWECGRIGTLLAGGGGCETARGGGRERTSDMRGRETVFRVLGGKQRTIFITEKGFKLTRFLSTSRINGLFVLSKNFCITSAQQESLGDSSKLALASAETREGGPLTKYNAHTNSLV